MFGIVGTIPDNSFPLVAGQVKVDADRLTLGNVSVLVNRGTPALIAAAVETLKYLNQPEPFCYLVGDIGDGEGSKKLYKYLADQLSSSAFTTLTFHYYQPDVFWFKKVVSTLEKMNQRPLLIADAGFMYVAKMSGSASFFDLFTPDAGELAYLADEKAPHPFYTRGFILHEDNFVPDLIKRAYQHGNAATYLLVKGVRDYLADKSGILAVIDSPLEESLEAIGGTGDTLTGIVSALISSGMAIENAAIIAARVNRLAGSLAKPNPASQIYDIVKHIPRALAEILNESSP
jgi:ADP-dependent NAD(P)H-hydrate dehydratase / NAD(P)H-hydrate epimerase